MTNLKSGSPLTADMVPLLTAGRSVLQHVKEGVCTFEEAFGGIGRGTLLVTLSSGEGYGAAIENLSYIGERGDDGWISWSGGENPVPGRRIFVRCRGDGGVFFDSTIPEPSEQFSWKEIGVASIIAFRLVSEAADKGSLPASPSVPGEGHGTGVVGWQPIETAPIDGREVLVYRPLARLTRDEPVAIKRLIGGDNHCWPRTVPEGATPCNPTDGSCHVTHWMPLPPPPAASVSVGTSRKASEPIPPVEGVNAELLEALKEAAKRFDEIREDAVVQDSAFMNEATINGLADCAEEGAEEARSVVSKATALEGGQ
jgi:hypothetical protein